MNAQAPSSTFNTQAARRSYLRLFGLWVAKGLSPRAAGALALACCETVEDIRRLGRAYFAGSPNCGTKTINELAVLAGWPTELKTPVDAVSAALALSISCPEERREAALDAVIGLRRAGFSIVVKRQSSPAGRR